MQGDNQSFRIPSIDPSKYGNYSIKRCRAASHKDFNAVCISNQSMEGRVYSVNRDHLCRRLTVYYAA